MVQILYLKKKKKKKLINELIKKCKKTRKKKNREKAEIQGNAENVHVWSYNDVIMAHLICVTSVTSGKVTSVTEM